MKKRDMSRSNGGQESFYSVLGVSRDADASEIKSAYRTIVADLDWEVADDINIAREAKKAYSVLGDKNMRMRYNNTLDAQAGYGGEQKNAASVNEGGDGFVTVYTIDRYGNWFIEKIERRDVPEAKGNDMYVLHLDGKKGDVLSRDLWNRWRDLCAIWRSKNVIKNSIGDVCLDVDLITMNHGRLEYTRTLRKVSQLPLKFPKAVGELGEIYAYKDGNGDVMIVERYDWMNLRRIMELQSSHRYENTGW